MYVYVINKNGTPLMPCKPAKAKHLLQVGKAKVIRRTPFTIKLLWNCEENVQEVVAGMDTGTKTIGCAATTNGKVVYQSEINIRQNIQRKMTQRRMYRRTRRTRKLRYRKPRWQNRASMRRKGRLAPSIKSKIDSHLKEKKFVESILPISRWKVELASFDIHRISNPTVIGLKYQNGPLKNFYNVKAYVLYRDSYQCQKCKNKKGKLHVHHIIFRKNGGADVPPNLITLYTECHNKLHRGEFEIKGVRSKTKHATEIGIIKSQLKKQFGRFEEIFGYETKFKREQILQLPKTHYNDAVAICSEGGEVITSLYSILVKRCVAKGSYKQTKGHRSEQKMQTGKIFGFRRFDKIRYLKNTYFIQSRSGAYAVLSDVLGNNVKFSNPKCPKFEKMEKLSSRKSWIMHEKINKL
jgi:hypothetical protein